MQPYLHSLRDGSEYLLPADTEVALGDGEAAAGAHGARARSTPRPPRPAGRCPQGEWEVRAVVSVAGFSHARSLRRNGAPIVLRVPAPRRIVARRGVMPRLRLARRLVARV